MAKSEERGTTYSQFACIGSGISAICLGATLKRWYGITDVRFFERHSDLGGTWFVNTYPGCACDIPSILYSFSFAPNPYWSTPLPSNNELWAYIKRVADRYDLPRKMTFGVSVESCTWIEESHRWRLSIRDVKTGNVFTHESQFLFSGTGVLVEPRKPDMPGIDNFKGPVFHASRWRSDVNLRNKNVAVFGNGCTGSQIVPAIQNDTKHVTQFIRSKHWIVPPVKVPNTKLMQWLFRNVPGVLAYVRWVAYFSAEKGFRFVPMTENAAAERKKYMAKLKEYIRTTAPEKYHDLLIPDFEVSCKRRIFDSGYLAGLHADNVTLTDDRVEEVVADGIRTNKGFVEADVIVLANGYSTNEHLPGIKVTGRNGTLKEHWAERGGAGAYNCCAVSGFPNFFMILGPNSATGHTSTILAAENNVNFALRIIKPVLDGYAMDTAVKPRAEEEYVNDIQRALKDTVFASGCNSWYIRDPEKGERVWNSTTYPYPQAHLWYESFFPKWRDWAYTPAPGAKLLRIWRALSRLAALVSFIVLLVGATRLWNRDKGNSAAPWIWSTLQSKRE